MAILAHDTEVKIHNVYNFFKYSESINTTANNSREKSTSSTPYIITSDMSFPSLPYLLCIYLKDKEGRNVYQR
jgi:hypothetical protein